MVESRLCARYLGPQRSEGRVMGFREMTYKEANERFTYDPETGKLFYKINSQTKKAGEEAGYDNGKGYLIVKVGYRRQRVARIAWLLSYGEWPLKDIDHVDRIRTNNRISNLRCVSRGDRNRATVHNREQTHA